jgi:hypothetical protein
MDGQETLSSPPGTPSCVVLQVVPPPVGFVDVSTAPAESRPTHKEMEGHDSEVIASPFDSADTLHAAAPPAGFVVLATTP